MAKARTPKTTKSTGKKATSKRAVAKKATAREGRANKAMINAERLRRDKRYYESQPATLDVLPRTGPTKKHPNGVTLASLQFDEIHNVYYHSQDREVRLTPAQYNKIPSQMTITNPYAVPGYTAIHNTKGRIVAFRNVYNGELVSTHYKYRMFNKHFNPKITPEEFREGRRLDDEELERAKAYEASTARQRYAKQSRTSDLVSSYKSLHPLMTRNQIVADPDFKNLVAQLELFHAGSYMNITEENKEMLRRAYGESVEQMNDEGFAQVLVDLGRRLPSDTQVPGTSDPGHIKFVVRPALDALRGTEDFEE